MFFYFPVIEMFSLGSNVRIIHHRFLLKVSNLTKPESVGFIFYLLTVFVQVILIYLHKMQNLGPF